MAIPDHFDGEADFVAAMVEASEKLLPIIIWLDDLHDLERRKITMAVFVLISQRVLTYRPHTPKEEIMGQVSVLYDLLKKGDLTDYFQDNK